MAHGGQRTRSLSLSFSMWIQVEARSLGQGCMFWGLSQELPMVLSPALAYDEVDLLLSSIPVKSLYCEETSLSCCNLVIRIRSVAASRASITEDAFLPFHSLDSVCIPLQFGPVCSQYRVWGSSVTKLRKHFTCWRSVIHCHRRTHKQSRMFQQWNAQRVPTLDTWLLTLHIHSFLLILVFFLAICPSVSTKSKSSGAQPRGLYQFL